MDNNTKYKLTTSERRIVTLAGLGGMLEFYDFIIYGIFSLYFADQIFPGANELISIIESYLVFILGYIARPVGGIIFSHIGDEYGRKRVLVTTIVLMGLASLLIGLLPTYAQIGAFSPVILLLLRLLQGLAIGGELPSTYVYVMESISRKSGSAFGIVMSLTVSGLLAGMLINQLLTKLLNHQELTMYGWRIPFIIGGGLCLVSYKIRKTLNETKEFSQIKNKSKFPLFDLLKNYFREVIIASILTATLASTVITFIVFMPTYLNKIVKLDLNLVNNIMPWTIIVLIASTFISGQVANYFSQQIILKVAIIVVTFLAGVCYWLIKVHLWYIPGLLILGLITGPLAMLVPAVITRLFPAKVRLSGVALSYNLGFTIFGGLAPVIITAFIKNGANIYLVPVLYIISICITGLISLHFIRKFKLNINQ